MDMVCKCGSTEFFTKANGTQTGLYCAECGKWQKWLGKSEVRVFEHQADDLYGRLLRRINESAIKVSTVRTPHQYMSAVGTKELDRILKEEFGIQPKDGVT